MGDQKRILVVDDDLGVREYLEAVVSNLGYEVSTVESGEAALERLERTPADLIILDVVLPGMSGFEMLKLVKERWPGVPVVFLSGHGQARNIVQAIREGAADFLRKPFEVKELEKILREVLAGQTATICPTCHGAGRV